MTASVLNERRFEGGREEHKPVLFKWTEIKIGNFEMKDGYKKLGKLSHVTLLPAT